MSYKVRFKKQKECPCCGREFYGYANQKFCIPSHSRIFWKYGNIYNSPKLIKRYEIEWERTKILKQSGVFVGER